MFIKSIEDKIKLTKLILILVLFSATLMVGIVSYYAYQTTINANNNIYVLDNNVPIVANRTNILDNREVEKMAHINYFHHLFFTLTPDDDYIKSQIEKSLYLIDESGFNEQLNLKERGFYSSILSSNSTMTVTTDSIVLDKEMKNFTFYAKQKITRRSAIIVRELITEGGLREVARSEKNSHGLIIENWRILSNATIQERRNYN